MLSFSRPKYRKRCWVMKVHFRDGDASPEQARILLGMSSLEADTLQTDHSTSQPTACLSAWQSCQPAELLRCLAALYPNYVFICSSLQLFFFLLGLLLSNLMPFALHQTTYINKRQRLFFHYQEAAWVVIIHSALKWTLLIFIHLHFQGRPAQAPSAFANFGTKHKEAQHRHKSFYL